jgi:hypothetical protein
MPASRYRSSRFLTDSFVQHDPVLDSLSAFYREELVRCQRCLELQREYYSDRVIGEAERALSGVMAQLDRLCGKADADRIVSHLLRQFDVVTGLSALSEPRQVH